MSIISKKIFKQGDTVTAPDINKVHTDLQGDSIGEDNTSPSWMTQKHWDNTSPKSNVFYKYQNDTLVDTGYTQDIYRTLYEGFDQARITTPFSMETGDALRLSFDGMISTYTCDVIGTSGANAPFGPYLDHHFSFRLLVNGVEAMGECGYSMKTVSKYTRHPVGPGDDDNDQFYRTFKHSLVYVNTGVTKAINLIELQIKLHTNTGTNEVFVNRHAIYVIHVRK